MKALLEIDFVNNDKYEQGFVTNKGRFVNRKEAKIIATLANQIISSTASDSLYSEDLY